MNTPRKLKTTFGQPFRYGILLAGGGLVVVSLMVLMGLDVTTTSKSPESPASPIVTLLIGTLILLAYWIVKWVWMWSSKRLDYKPKNTGKQGWDDPT